MIILIFTQNIHVALKTEVNTYNHIFIKPKYHTKHMANSNCKEKTFFTFVVDVAIHRSYFHVPVPKIGPKGKINSEGICLYTNCHEY